MSTSVVTDGGGGRRREWITVDKLGLFVIGDKGWIELNQINCGKWMVVWYGMTWHA